MYGDMMETWATPHNICGEDVAKLWEFIQKLDLPEDFIQDIYQLEDIAVYKGNNYWRIALNNGEKWMTIEIEI